VRQAILDEPKRLQPLLPVCILLGFALVSTGTSCSRADAVDEIVKTEIAKQRIPGAAVAIVRGGKIIKAGAYVWPRGGHV